MASVSACASRFRLEPIELFCCGMLIDGAFVICSPLTDLAVELYGSNAGGCNYQASALLFSSPSAIQPVGVISWGS
jgi:hypothetical protein